MRKDIRWLVDPKQINVSCRHEFEPLSDEDRMYHLRLNFINMFHEPVAGKKLIAVSRDEFLNDDEWTEKREQSKMHLEDPEMADLYKKIADNLGNATPVRVLVDRNVQLCKGKKRTIPLALDTHVLRLGRAGAILRLVSGESVKTVIAKNGGSIIDLATFLNLVEKVLFKEAMRLHDEGQPVDSNHPFVEMNVCRCDDEATIVHIHLGS